MIATVLAEASLRATIAAALAGVILAVARTRAPGVRHAVWASILFDIKENLAVFVGPLLAAAWLMAGTIAEENDTVLRRWFAGACVSAGALAWWITLAGLLVGSVRSV